MSVASLERRLSGITWHYRQLGQPLDTQDRHIATVLAGIRRAHGRPPVQKEAIFADDLLAMLATLDNDLRGLRDRAILAIGFAGGLRRSEIVGLDCGPEPERRRNRLDRNLWRRQGAGAAKNEGGTPPALKTKAPPMFREPKTKAVCCSPSMARPAGVRSRSDAAPAPSPAPSRCSKPGCGLAGSPMGPLFRRVTKKNTGVTSERLTDKHVARLVQKTALAAGIRGDLSEGERKLAFSGHSLRAGLASSAKIEEAHVQRHLGHASAEMTRRYQRKRDRFKVNLTKAAGL